MIKHRRDESHLVIKTKIFIEDYPGKFFRVCLWDDQEAMCNASAEQCPRDTQAFVCHSPYFHRQSKAGPLEALQPRLLGEMHFLAGKWTEEVVAHECFHATIGILNSLLIDPRLGIGQEEMGPYIHGELFRDVYRWLWRVDDARKRPWPVRIWEWLISWVTCIRSMYK